MQLFTELCQLAGEAPRYRLGRPHGLITSTLWPSATLILLIDRNTGNVRLVGPFASSTAATRAINTACSFVRFGTNAERATLLDGSVYIGEPNEYLTDAWRASLKLEAL